MCFALTTALGACKQLRKVGSGGWLSLVSGIQSNSKTTCESGLELELLMSLSLSPLQKAVTYVLTHGCLEYIF